MFKLSFSKKGFFLSGDTFFAKCTLIKKIFYLVAAASIKKPLLFLIAMTICTAAFPFGKKDKPAPAPVAKEQPSKPSIFDIDPNSTDAHGNTPLHIAAQNIDADMAEFLIFKKANTEAVNTSGLTPLQVAMNYCAQGGDTVQSNSDDSNVIFLGEQSTNAQVIATKTDASQNIARPSAPLSPTQKRLLATLINGGASIYAKYPGGNTPLDVALSRGIAYFDIFINKDTAASGKLLATLVERQNLDAVDYYITQGLPVNIAYENDSALETAVSHISTSATRPNNTTSCEIMAKLINAGADIAPVQDGAYGYFVGAVASRNVNRVYDYGQTALLIAASRGDAQVAQWLLDNGARTNAQETSGSTSLHIAIRNGNYDIAKLLLSHGANINARDNLMKTPLLIQISPTSAHKASDFYTLLLQNGAATRVQDSYGDTPLHIATLTGQSIDVLTMLNENGAELDAQNKDGKTPLLIAIQKKNASHIEFYARNRANINTEDNKGQSPLKEALCASEKFLETIVTRNNVEEANSLGDTPLHVAIKENATLTKIQYILSLMDDVDSRNAQGNTPLYLSVLKNRPKLGALLFAKGANVFITNIKNQSPLSLSLLAPGGVIEWVIADNPNVTDGGGNTIMHYAADWGVGDAVPVLAKHGANIDARNSIGQTPLFFTCHDDNDLVAKTLFKNGAHLDIRDNMGRTALFEAVQCGALSTSETLIDLGSNIDTQDDSGECVLTNAISTGRLDIAKMLLDKNANPNIQDTLGQTPLMKVANSTLRQDTTLAATKLLLQYNANVDLTDSDGNCALHIAARNGTPDLLALLRIAGADPLSRNKASECPFGICISRSDVDSKTLVAILGNGRNTRDSDGNTPLHIAVAKKTDTKNILSLIAMGNTIDSRNSSGFTPLNLAIKNNDVPRALTLLANGADPFIMIDKSTCGITLALQNNNEEIIDGLAKYSGSGKDVQGNTFLHYAAISGKKDVVTKLLSFGLDSSKKNNLGETPYMTAIRWKKTDVAQVLQSAARS